MMKLKLFLLFSILFCALVAKAQIISGPGAPGGYYRDISLNWNGTNLVPNAGAQLTVCASTATTSPCSPAITIYSNAALTITQPNPITTGTDGSWSLFLPPGQYSYTVTGTGLNPQGPFIFTVVENSGGGGNVAIKPQPSAAIEYVDTANGNDQNDGLSAGTAKATISAACAALPNTCNGGPGTINVTGNQTLSTLITLTGVKVIFNAGSTLTIAQGGGFIVGVNSVLDAAGSTFSFTGSSGDAVKVNGSLSVVRIGFLLFQGTGSTANGLVFVGNAGQFNQAQFNRAEVGIIKNFPANDVQFGRSGVGGAINNLLIAQQIVGGGTGVFFPSGVSGTDIAAFDEGNVVMCSLNIGWTVAGVKFGDGGTLADALFNKYYGDVHDQSAGGIIPINFTDNNNTFVGDLFSDHGTFLATFGASAANNNVTSPDLNYPSAATGAGLVNNIVTASNLLAVAAFQSPLYNVSNGSLTYNNSGGTGQGKIDLESGTTITVRNLVTGGDRWYLSFAPPETINIFGGANNDSNAVVKMQNGSLVNASNQLYPTPVAEVNLTAQAANITATTLYAVPASGAGMYRVSGYVVETTAAGTSSTLPTLSILWTDTDTSVAENPGAITAVNSNNTVGSIGGSGGGIGVQILSAKASTNIQYSTASYASNPASAMQYALHIRVEFLGP